MQLLKKNDFRMRTSAGRRSERWQIHFPPLKITKKNEDDKAEKTEKLRKN